MNDWGVLLSPIQDANAGEIRGVITGSTKVCFSLLNLARKFVRTKDIKVAQVPTISGLTTPNIIKLAIN